MRIRSVLGASAVLLLTSASLAFAQTDCKTLVPPSPWGPNDQTGCTPSIAFPFASFATARKRITSPVAAFDWAGSMVSDVGVAEATSTTVVDLMPPAAAVRVAFPGPRASTTPLPLTRATEAAELVQRTESYRSSPSAE